MDGKRKSHIITGIVFIAVCIVIGVLLAVMTTPRRPDESQNVIAAADSKADAIDAAATAMDAEADETSNKIAGELNNDQSSGDGAGDPSDPFTFYKDGKLVPGAVVLDKDVFGTLNGSVHAEVLGKQIDSQEGIIRLAIEGDIPQSDYRGMLLHRCGSISDYRWMTFTPPLGDEVGGKQADAAAADVVDKKVMENIFKSFCPERHVEPLPDQLNNNGTTG